MASLQSQFKVVEIFQLAPPPQSVATQSSLPFTFYDIAWLYAAPVERIFFFQFPCSTSTFNSSVISNLKHSLSQALNIFYPLYGKIRPSQESDNKFELRYVEGDSVSFIVAQLDNEDFDELSSNNARDINRLLPLRPQLLAETIDGAKPVLAIQVTLFPNQGITIGISVHHAACDGHTSTRFLSTWATICRTGTSSLSPLFDRKLISDPNDLSSTYLRAWSTFSPAPATSPKSNVVSRTFTLTSNQIQRLKDAITAKANDDNGSPMRCSTIVVTYALVWVCLVRARKFSSDRTAHFAFAVNCSHGHQPPIPPEYFGNRIGALFVQFSAGELFKEEGVVVAAKAIIEVINKFRKNALDGAETWIDKWLFLATQQPFSVAGSPQLKVYDTDFGWGKPKKVEITSILESGAMALAESRGDEGGVEFSLMIQQGEMDEFATQFSNGLKMLSAENYR